MTSLRYVAAAALLVVGGLTGVAAVAVHTRWWGLPLAALGLAAALGAVGPGWLTRLPLALGFVAVVGGAVPRRSEGDYVVASGTPGSLLLLLTLLVLLAALATLPRPTRVAKSAGAGPPT